MRHSGLHTFLSTLAGVRGPIALIFAEDEVEIESTVFHHYKAGFSYIVLFAPEDFETGKAEEIAIRVDCATHDNATVCDVLNAVMERAEPDTWIYYCYNAEYLFHPFSETRNVREMLAFHSEERRKSMLAYVIDLYADDLTVSPNGVSLKTAHFDRTGYYAQARRDPDKNYEPKERQLDFYGGLRWRFEELVPYERRRIDRIAFSQAKPGVKFQPDHTMSSPERSTYACPWHSNLTAAICSFRVAKALRTNASSRNAVQDFNWHNSVQFEWRAQQLMDLGLIEPGQWF